MQATSSLQLRNLNARLGEGEANFTVFSSDAGERSTHLLPQPQASRWNASQPKLEAEGGPWAYPVTASAPGSQAAGSVTEGGCAAFAAHAAGVLGQRLLQQGLCVSVAEEGALVHCMKGRGVDLAHCVNRMTS